MHKAKWTVGLSNGETLHEEKGDFCTITGALSPWQRLLGHLAEAGATITSLSLYADDGRRWNLPSAGKAPKFKAFAEAPKPVSFRMFRKAGADLRQDGSVQEQDLFTVAEATYEDGKKLQVWVDEGTLNSWNLVSN